VLEKAGEIMHAFFSSRGVGYTDTKDHMEALLEYGEWGKSQPSELIKALDEIDIIMSAILFFKKGGKWSDLEKASRKESPQDPVGSLNSDG
jgi:hypothetical protein